MTAPASGSPPPDGSGAREPQHPAPAQPAGEPAGSGHPAVDAVRDSLANVAGLPPAEQIAEYEAAHRVLQETLASIDET